MKRSGGHNRTPASVERMICKLYLDGEKVDWICHVIGCQHETVTAAVRRNGYPVRPSGRPRKYVKPPARASEQPAGTSEEEVPSVPRLRGLMPL